MSLMRDVQAGKLLVQEFTNDKAANHAGWFPPVWGGASARFGPSYAFSS